MRLVNLREAKTHFSALVYSAAAGEEIIIAKEGKPLARLLPLEHSEPRRPGVAKGRVTEAFFEPLPEEELKGFLSPKHPEN